VYALAAGGQAIESQYSVSGQLLHQRNHRQNKDIDYIYLGQTLIASQERVIGGSANTARYQHTDALGTPLVVTGSNKAVVESSTYEPYGQLINRTPFDGPGYTGHVHDAVTGLTYMQQRYYDPLLGVFLSVDPVMAYNNPVSQFHRYRYANGNPYAFVDPNGVQSKAMGKEIGRWIKALWENDGDFEKAKEQVNRLHETDLKVAEFVADFTALGPAKDAVQIAIKVANDEDFSGQISGAAVGELSGMVVEKILDGRIGGDAASFVGTSVDKVVGDSIEFVVDSFQEGSSGEMRADSVSDDVDYRGHHRLD